MPQIGNILSLAPVLTWKNLSCAFQCILNVWPQEAPYSPLPLPLRSTMNIKLAETLQVPSSHQHFLKHLQTLTSLELLMSSQDRDVHLDRGHCACTATQSSARIKVWSTFFIASIISGRVAAFQKLQTCYTGKVSPTKMSGRELPLRYCALHEYAELHGRYDRITCVVHVIRWSMTSMCNCTWWKIKKSRVPGGCCANQVT